MPGRRPDSSVPRLPGVGEGQFQPGRARARDGADPCDLRGTRSTTLRFAKHRRCAGALALVAAAAALAAGCGSDAGRASPGRGASEPVTMRTVVAPEADPDLTKELGPTGTELTTAGCSFGSADEQEPLHVDEGDELSGGEFPPTSGRHFEDWAPFGVYDEPLEDGFVVHDLEHGGVAVWLGTRVDEATTTAIGRLPKQDEKWVVAPRADIEGLFSAAWTKGLSCPPGALEKLGPEGTADAVEEWYRTVVSTGSKAEKDVPAYAGAMKEPSPERDISTESPF